MAPTVTLLVPTINEIEGMRQIMPQVKREWCDQILVVDGSSTDGTLEYATSQGYEVYVQQKGGARHAYIEAMSHVKGDIVIEFSPDGNSVPEVIPKLIEEIKKGYDMVIASRYLNGAKSEDDNVISAFGNWMFTKLINWLHGGCYTDAMVMYRAYWKKIFFDLELDRDESYRTELLFRTVMGIEPLMSIRAAKRKLRVTEIPGDEPPRIGGQSKLLPFRWGGSYFLQVLREVYYWR